MRRPHETEARAQALRETKAPHGFLCMSLQAKQTSSLLSFSRRVAQEEEGKCV